MAVNDMASQIGGWPINNHDRQANGVIDFLFLQVSSNVGMVVWQSPSSPIGIGSRSLDEAQIPIFPGPVIKTKEQFTTQPIEPATASFGHGFLTPSSWSVRLVANGGRLIVLTSRGCAPVMGWPGIALGVALDGPDVTRTVLAWMESVVQKGSGKGAFTPGYRIGGKTGTAQKAQNGIYVPGAKICSFVATLPIEDPRYVVLVVVDEPQGENAYGSTVAVPVAKQIIDGLLVIEKIPPSGARTALEPALAPAVKPAG